LLSVAGSSKTKKGFLLQRNPQFSTKGLVAVNLHLKQKWLMLREKKKKKKKKKKKEKKRKKESG
jgi:hypothetical protein